jgi:hypothetical protein
MLHECAALSVNRRSMRRWPPTPSTPKVQAEDSPAVCAVHYFAGRLNENHDFLITS